MLGIIVIAVQLIILFGVFICCNCGCFLLMNVNDIPFLVYNVVLVYVFQMFFLKDVSDIKPHLHVVQWLLDDNYSAFLVDILFYVGMRKSASGFSLICYFLCRYRSVKTCLRLKF